MSQRHSASLHMTCARCRVEVEYSRDVSETQNDGSTIRRLLDLDRTDADWGKVGDLDGTSLDLCSGCSKAFQAWIEGDPSMWAKVMIGTADHPDAPDSLEGSMHNRVVSSGGADHPQTATGRARATLLHSFDPDAPGS